LILLVAVPAVAWFSWEGWPGVADRPPLGTDDPLRPLRIVELPRRTIPPPRADEQAFLDQDDIGTRLNEWRYTNEMPSGPYR
jgi:hypothetical protein